MNEDMKKIIKGCKGCYVRSKCVMTHGIGSVSLDNSYKNKIINCPCKICIVKMICDIDICDQYKKVWG